MFAYINIFGLHNCAVRVLKIDLMNIYVNNTLKELPEPVNVTAMLELLEMASAKGLAVAVNNNVISRTDWGNHLLQPEDKITLIRATQGG